jgi:MoaA/NifB/PqqE/SkfB family radical SAM enzyme
MSAPKVYRKHNSFVGLKTKGGSLESAQARLKTVLEKPGTGERGAIVKQACEEALGIAAAPKGHAPFTLTPNVLEELARLEDKHLQRYLHYRFRYECFPARKLLDAMPPLVQIEPTSVCNFRCVFCYQTEKAFTKKSNGFMGHMSLELFKKLIDGLEGSVEAVTLASRGEPLLNTELEAMLSYARGKFLALKLNTNASLLDEKKIHAILQSDVQTLVFSADAAVEPTYSRLRVGGKLDQVLGNVRKFADIRAKQYPDQKMITRVSGVKVDGTSDLADMEKVWGGFVDQVAFVAYNPWENAYEAPLTEIETPCSDLWRRMFVWWDGCTNPCDVDFKSELSVGNAKDSGISALWRGEKYEGLRKAHLEKLRSSLSPCSRCSVV